MNIRKYLATASILTGILPSLLSQAPDFTGIRIVLDPGHGGYESDDRGMPNGFWESESNLTKAFWLADLLEDRGCEVILTRYGNDGILDDPGLSERAQVAIDNVAGMFLSIHSNAGNQVSNYPLTIFNGKTATPTVPSSKEWAIVLWNHLKVNESTFWTGEGRYIGDLTLNPTWTTGYGVLVPLNKPQITGIISEGSFHDYQPEMDRLLNLDYRRQEAYHMLYALIDFYELEGRETLGNISGIVRDSLLEKEYYTLPDAADGYENVNGTLVELLETGETYRVDSLNTGFYMFDSIVPGTYHLVFSAEKYFNDTVEVDVEAHRFTYHNQWMTADKTMPPEILSFSPDSAVATPCFDPVTFRFSMNMDSASVADAFSIMPGIKGSWTWDKKYLNGAFQPCLPYDTETTYTVVLDTTAQHQWGVGLDTILSFRFTTGDRNRYSIETTYPVADQEEISPFLQFRVIFDAPVHNTSLIDAVWIEGPAGARLGTKGADISTSEGKGHYYFEAADVLGYGTDYTLVLSGSIRDEGNIPLVDTQYVAFTTMEDPGLLTVLDEMDDTDGWSIDMAASSGIDDGTFLYKWKKEYLSGSAATLLRYNFLSEDANCTFRPVDSLELKPEFDSLGIWVWGEMSHQELAFGFNNETEVSPGNIDFAGWYYLAVPVPEGASALEYIRLRRANPLVAGGDLIFDMLHQPGFIVSAGTPELSGIRIYPNPLEGDVIHLKGTGDARYSYSVYSLQGKLLGQGDLEAGQRSLYLGDIPSGAHVLKLESSRGTFRTLIIKN